MLIRTGVGFGANTIPIVQILIFTAFKALFCLQPLEMNSCKLCSSDLLQVESVKFNRSGTANVAE